MTENIVKSHDYSIGGYLRDLKAKIPEFQRSYEWKEDQINDFIEDLMSVVDSNSTSKYFFGPIITTSGENSDRKEIIDGQQRLTTITVFFAVIRDILNQYSSEVHDARDTIFEINKHLIGEGTDRYNYKIEQVGNIKETFRDFIQKDSRSSNPKKIKEYKGPKSKGMGKANNIIRAYNLLFEYFQDKLSKIVNMEEKVSYITKIYSVIEQDFFIVEIWAPNKTEAFQIFQTINARGIDLTAADLIKSDFFGNSKENHDDVTILWKEVKNIIGDLNYSNFLRYTWNSLYPFTTSRWLYKFVSKEINTPEKIMKFMQMLNKLSKAYAELNGDNDVKHLSNSEDGKAILNILLELNALNFKTFYPLYLAMINQEFSEKNIKVIMNEVSNLLIRNKILNKGTNWLEKLLSQKGRYINNSNDSEINKTDKILNELKNEMPNDKVIAEALRDYDLSNDIALVRYILRRIENSKLREKGYIPFDNSYVHVEHIMPKSPKELSDWGVTPELHENYLWEIGNMTLWLGKLNSSEKNNKFEIKKVRYKDSDIRMTRQLADCDQWTTSEIKSRTKKIIKLFLKL